MLEANGSPIPVTPHSAAASHALKRRSIAVVLLFLFMAINFADKVVLGLVAIPMMQDMNLTPAQFGLAGSSFFLLFSLSGIAIGLVADRVDTKWLMAALAATWTIAQLPLGWPTTFTMLLICRIVLGIGEGPASPLALHVAYTWFDDRERNLPTTAIQQGATIGVIASGPLLTLIAQRWHWHAAFISLGLASLAWMILWLWIGNTGRYQHVPVKARTGEQKSVPLFSLLGDRTVVGVMLQCFVAYAIVAIGFTWTPAYFRAGLGFPAAQAGWLFALQVSMQIPVGFALALVSHRLLKRGVPSRLARGALISSACVAAGLAYGLLHLGVPPVAKVALMALASALAVQTFTFGPMIVAEVVPTARRGALLAITNSIVTLAGLLGPVGMGHLIGWNGGREGYETGFAVTGVLLLAVGVAGFALLDPQRSRQRLTYREST
ncbi:hypothetical protein WS97_30120 [Burkholderia territorii]|uniref:MFS transporter n=1 Tax=Burkholderia territorii TaxID=1503055 RepID=UPI000757C45C|nr:MFS transporter [Burkholderia territorii]KVL25555.1 hypothetical protein WS97_30120 [Burkholderia territorii]